MTLDCYSLMPIHYHRAALSFNDGKKMHDLMQALLRAGVLALALCALARAELPAAVAAKLRAAGIPEQAMGALVVRAGDEIGRAHV